MILAGGFGTRIRHLMPNLPKPMASVLGKPFISWICQYLQDQGYKSCQISTGYLGKKIENYFNHWNTKKILTVNCISEVTPLGTGGAIIHTTIKSKKRPKAWLIMNGDSLIPISIKNIEEFFFSLNVDALLIGLKKKDASRYGTLQFDSKQRLKSFTEKKPGYGVINSGIYFFKNNLLEAFPKEKSFSLEKDVFPRLLNNNFDIRVYTCNAPFIDIGTPKTLAEAQSFISSHFLNG